MKVMSARGNARTVGRVLRGLAARNVVVETAELADAAAYLAKQSAFDVCHFFHLTQSFEALQASKVRLAVPYVLTQTGTDMWPAPCRTPEFIEFLCGASCISVYQQTARQLLLEHYPELRAERVQVVLKSVDLPPLGAPLPAAAAAFVCNHLVVFLPAHLRPVKGVECALAAFAHVRASRAIGLAPIALLIAGDILDAAYAQRLRMDRHPGVLHVAFNRAQMVSAYACAAVVLNTSFTESSPNALLEALYLGKPVVARNIPGVRGLAELAAERLASAEVRAASAPIALFEDSSELSLETVLRDCLDNPDRRLQMSTNAQRAFAYLGDVEREGAVYRDIYVAAFESRASANLIK
jgi:L-malate glycosyltransferase